jgi:hypothetical protein
MQQEPHAGAPGVHGSEPPELTGIRPKSQPIDDCEAWSQALAISAANWLADHGRQAVRK